MQAAHISGQRWLIAHSRRNTAKQRRHFGASLCKAEDVINEEEHIFALLIAEIFSLCKTCQSNTGTRAWRLVHLAINQRHAAVAFKVDHFGVDHFVIKIVTFTGPLTHTGKDRVSTEEFRDIVDQLLNKNGLANTRAAKEANLTAFCIGAKQIDHFDTCDKDFRLSRLVHKFWCRGMDWHAGSGFNRAALINRLTNNVHDAAKCFRANWHHDWLAKVSNLLATHKTFS